MSSQYNLSSRGKPAWGMGGAIRSKAKAGILRVRATAGVVLLFAGLMTAPVLPSDLTYSPEQLDNMVAPIALLSRQPLNLDAGSCHTYPLESSRGGRSAAVVPAEQKDWRARPL